MKLIIITALLLYIHRTQSTTLPGLSRQPQFSDRALQPKRPAAAVATTYNFVQELSAWSDLQVLVRLVTMFPDLVDAALSPEPLLIFAPTNSAFLAIAAAFFETPDDADVDTIAGEIARIFEILAEAAPASPTAKDVLTYHIISGDFPEHRIRALKELKTLLGDPLSTSAYPRLIGDLDPTFDSTRLGRQIKTTNGRISITDNVLLPFEVDKVLSENDITLPITSRMGDSNDSDGLFPPLQSLVKFVTSRIDLTVLATLAAGSETLLDVLSNSESLHVFAPTDRSFLKLVQALIPEDSGLELLPEKGEGALGNVEEIAAFAGRLASTWTLLEDVPSLEEIVSYHVLNTAKNYSDLVGEGPQQTLLGGDATIEILKKEVRDNDPDRGDAPLVASWATRNGFVSIIDDVLLPFSASTAIDAVNKVLGDGLQPSPTEEIEVSPSPEPEAGDGDDDDDPVCFPAHVTVQLYDGSRKRMDQLDAGDNVAVSSTEHSPVYLFTHRLREHTANFVTIETDCDRAVTLTQSHYVYANGRLTSAGVVKIGETLETDKGVCRVVKLTTSVERGLFAPHTMHGDLVVNGVRVSSYSTAVEPRFAHWGLSFVRVFVKMGFKEPFGRWFYEGAPSLAAVLPKGHHRY